MGQADALDREKATRGKDLEAWRSRWERIPSIWRIALGLVGVQLLVRAWVVTGSYFYQDDFAHLEMARRVGWSTQYLVRDYGGHLEMGQYALIWLVSHLIDGSFLPAALSVLLMQGVASLLLFAVLRALFGSSALLLVPFSVYLFTPLALAWSAWWAAAVQTLPLQIFMLATILGTVRFHQTGQRRWAVLAVLAHAAGLVFWQKALLILPIVLAVYVLVVAEGGTRDRWRAWVRRWRLWSAQGLVVGIYVSFYTSVVSGLGEQGSVTLAQVRDVLGTTLLDMLVPGLLGGPWHADDADKTIYPLPEGYLAALFTAAFLALVVLSFRVTGRRAALGWIVLGGYLTADLVLLVVGRADWLGLLARDPRYVADALPIVAVALAAAFRGALEDTGEPSPLARSLRDRAGTTTALKVVLVLGVSCAVTTFQLAPAVQYHYPRNYVSSLTSQLDADVRVADTQAPPEFAARVTVAGLVRAVGRSDEAFHRAGTELMIVDAWGSLRPLTVFGGSPETPGPLLGCGWRLGTVPTVVTQVEEGRQRVLKVDFASLGEADLAARLGGEEQVLEVAGAGAAYFLLPDEAGAVELTATPPESGVCVSTVTVGPPWVADQ